MAEFLVKVADERGRVTQQMETAYSEAELRDRFNRQGCLIYWIKPRDLFAGFKVSRKKGKIKLGQFVVFNQQFVTLIHAGLPIVNALDLLIKRHREGYLRSVLTEVRDRVKGGQSLSEAFEAQAAMPKIYTTTILAGEKSGNLEEVLTRYGNFQRMTMSFRKKLQSSLIYPSLLVVMVVVMLTFLVTYVVPQFATLYEQLDVQLPAMTVFMLEIGRNAQKYFPVVIAGIVAIVAGLWQWSRTSSGAQRIDAVRLRLPLLGQIWLKYQVAMFSRMMSTLLAGGLPLVTALDTAGSSMQSRYIAAGVATATKRVREGRPLAKSLEETNTFPELSVEMIEVGESTGALPVMLNSVAEFYEEDVQNALTAAMSLIEPVILIFMGTIVAAVLISLYLPIFSLGSSGALH
jgi:type IV pilus assembly protein PilC